MPVTRKTSKGLANGVRSSAKHKLAPAYREKQGGKVKAPSLRSVPKKPSDYKNKEGSNENSYLYEFDFIGVYFWM